MGILIEFGGRDLFSGWSVIEDVDVVECEIFIEICERKIPDLVTWILFFSSWHDNSYIISPYSVDFLILTK